MRIPQRLIDEAFADTDEEAPVFDEGPIRPRRRPRASRNVVDDVSEFQERPTEHRRTNIVEDAMDEDDEIPIPLYQPERSNASINATSSSQHQHGVQQPQNFTSEVDETSMLLVKTTNLVPLFNKSTMGRMIAHELLSPNIELTESTQDDAINHLWNIIIKKTKGQIWFGHRKRKILETLAKSLVLSFPKLKREISDFEDPAWIYVR